MNTIWIFRNGLSRTECTSFPYAFRSMYATVRHEVEKLGKNKEETIKKMFIISPLKDRDGKHKVYSYDQACEMATNQGLIDDTGRLNSKEYKR